MPETRKSFTVLKKLEIVEFVEVNGNRKAGRYFEVPESSIRLCRKRKPLLKCMNQNKRAGRGRKEYWPELEKDLKIWIVNQRKDERKISTVAIKFKAKILAQERLIENFKASDQWCNRFMKRNRPLSVNNYRKIGMKSLRISRFS